MSVGIERDLRSRSQALLGLGVDLAEDDVGVRLGRLLEDRGEHAARAAPGRPEVDEDDVVPEHGLLEVGGCEGSGGHGFSSRCEHTGGGIRSLQRRVRVIPEPRGRLGNGCGGPLVDDIRYPPGYV